MVGERGNGKRGARVAGVVVLYHPGADLADNIASYLGDLEFLVAVDNTERPDPAVALLLANLAGVEYLPLGDNLGIARALNVGAEKALAAGCEFLLTMDQDSRAEAGMVASLLACCERAGEKAGIVSPFHVTRPGEAPPPGNACREVPVAMTSGNLVRLAAYLEAGPFRDGLFMDFVDVEYCLRLRRAGYRIVRADGALLRHAVGEKLRIPFLGGDFSLTSHTPLRKYYKTRNRFYVAAQYGEDFPDFCRRDRRRFVLELLRLLLFEPRKVEKLRMMWRGWRDFRAGKTGKRG